MKKSHIPAFILLLALLAMVSFACRAGAEAQPTAPQEAVQVSESEPTRPSTHTPTPEPTPTEMPPQLPATQPHTPEAPPSAEGCVEGELAISYIDGYLDDYDTWNIIGKVCNQTGSPVGGLEIQIEILDPSGASIFSDTAYPYLYNIADGAESPFELSLWEELPVCTGEVQCTVVAEVLSYEESYADLVALELQNYTTAVDEYGSIYIAGELFNNTRRPVNLSTLAVTVNDTAGNLVAADSYAAILHYVDPGLVAPFRFTVLGSKGPISASELGDFQLYMDAQVYTPEEVLANPQTDVSELVDFMDNWDSFHMVGTYTNNHTTAVGPRFVVAVYNAEGQVLDVAYTDTPVSSVAPGETIPMSFDFWGPIDSLPGLYELADTYQVFVDPYWTWEAWTDLIALTTTGESNDYDGRQGVFTGQVSNNSGADIQFAVVIISLYDSDDNLRTTGYAYADIDGVLAAGGNAGYDVYVPLPKGSRLSDFSYVITVKGARP